MGNIKDSEWEWNREREKREKENKNGEVESEGKKKQELAFIAQNLLFLVGSTFFAFEFATPEIWNRLENEKGNHFFFFFSFFAETKIQ